MKLRGLYLRVICFVVSILLCFTACAEVLDTQMPPRVGISINEIIPFERLAKNEYTALVYPSTSALVITGIYDAESIMKVMLNGADCTEAGCTVEYYPGGSWQCIVPVSALIPSAYNELSFDYADGDEEAVVCNIYLDADCALDIGDVYEYDAEISGTTDPGATVVLLCGGEQVSVAYADEYGCFSMECDISDDAGDYSLKAIDEGGNICSVNVDVRDADIYISAPEMVNETCAVVEITAIPGSCVQLMTNSAANGEAVYTDDAGNAVAQIDGLENGCSYSVEAVYAGEYEGYGKPSHTIHIAVDTEAPAISADEAYLESGAAGVVIELSEDCTVRITADDIGYVCEIEGFAGENEIIFAELPVPTAVENGIAIRISATDAAGNECEIPVELEVVAPAEALLNIDGMGYGDTNVLDAMEAAVITGRLYVPDADCYADIIISGDELHYVLATVGGAVHAADEDTVLPFVIEFDLDMDTSVLPAGKELYLEFRVKHAGGDDVTGTERLNIPFRLEKNERWLMVRAALLAAIAAVFAAALWLYIRTGKKQRLIRRNNGIRRKTRAGKRGGAWG